MFAGVKPQVAISQKRNVVSRLPVGCAMIAALSGCGNDVDAQAEGISAVSRAPDGGYSYHVYSCEGYKTGGSKVLASERAARIEDLQKALLMLERGSSDTPAPEPSR